MNVDLISDDVVFHVYTRGYSGLLCLQFVFLLFCGYGLLMVS